MEDLQVNNEGIRGGEPGDFAGASDLIGSTRGKVKPVPQIGEQLQMNDVLFPSVAADMEVITGERYRAEAEDDYEIPEHLRSIANDSESEDEDEDEIGSEEDEEEVDEEESDEEEEEDDSEDEEGDEDEGIEEDLLEKPLPYDYVLNEAERELFTKSLEAAGHKVAADGSNIEALLNALMKDQPIATQKYIAQVERDAKAYADKYLKEKIEPYKDQQDRLEVREFVVKFGRDVPSVLEYLPTMKKLYSKLEAKYPEVLDDPVRSIPMLMLMATQQKRLQKRQADKPERPGKKHIPVLESGGARRPQTSAKKDPEAGIFKGTDKLAGLFR